MSFALRDETGPAFGAMPIGLAAEPPLSPTPLGARPAAVEQPAQPAVPAEPEPAGTWSVEDADAGPRRVVVRLLGGDHIELAEVRSRDEAFALAREVVLRISAAEAAGEWPELEGRLVRSGAIVSVDVLRTER